MKEMKGLTTFIVDIRACKNADAELKRVNKELANIRAKFGNKKGVNGYDKKKYVCKLLFMFLLGYDVEFGHIEAVNLLSATSFSEKQMGYLFVSVLLTEASELAKLVIKAIEADLSSRLELNVCLALNCVANIGGPDITAAVAPQIQRLLVAPEAPPFVRKKASLCLLRLLRESPSTFPHGEHTSKFIQLLTHPDLGVVMSVVSLLTALADKKPEEYEGVVHVAVNRLHRLVTLGAGDSDASLGANDYTYYDVHAPWLVVKLLRLLQLYPAPRDHAVLNRVNESLRVVLPRPGLFTARTKQQIINAANAIFFDAVHLLVAYDGEHDLQVLATTQLGNHLQAKDPNLRFLALEGLSAMAHTDFSSGAVKRFLPSVLKALKSEQDSTVQRRCVDVLYAVCDKESVVNIVAELLLFLTTADYSAREETVLKIAILAEKHVTDFKWYIDTMLKLIRLAGDFVTQEVWFRVVQVIVNHQDVQDYAAKTVFEALLAPAAHDNLINVAAYVLGEFGHLIANDPNSSPLKQYGLLSSHYPMLPLSSRQLLLTTFVKFANLFPEIKGTVQSFLGAESLQRNSNAELQQRANEYFALINVANPAVLPSVLEEMPPFSEGESGILAKLEKAGTISEGTGTAAARRKSKPVAAPLAAVSAAAHAQALTPRTGAQVTAPSSAVTNDAFVAAFACSMNGVLYENPVLQIGVKSEFHLNIGRVSLYYGNRGQVPITNLATRAYATADPDALKLQVNTIDSTIAPGVQCTQVIQVECISPFSMAPLLDVNLTYQGKSILLTLKLPITLNKFMQPLASALSAEQFFAKWKQLGGPPRECKQVVKVKAPIVKAATESKLAAFGFPAILGIDPNADNSVSASILHTANGQFGLLLRVEPSLESQMFRLTLRTPSDDVSAIVCDLLSMQFF